MKRRDRSRRGGVTSDYSGRAFGTEPCPWTGYMVDEFCRAAIERCYERGVGGLSRLFEPFVDGETRINVPIGSVMRRMKLRPRADPDVRIQKITDLGRQIAWEMMSVHYPERGLPSNPYRLMPSIIVDDDPLATSTDQSVALHRVTSYRGEPISQYLRTNCQRTMDRLDASLRGGQLAAIDATQFAMLRLWLEDVSGIRQPLQTGDQLCDFRLEHPLRTNQYREIFRARSIETGKRVVIKTLTPQATTVPRERIAFSKSTIPHQSLRHPSIPQIVVPYTEVCGVPFYAVEYIEGTPLSRMERRGRGATLKLLLSIAQLLAELHENRITCGDLSPPNIIVQTNGSPTLTDFESSRGPTDNDFSGSVSSSISNYLSPENRRDPTRLEQSDDVYAFGILACDLLDSRQMPPGLVIAELRENETTRALADVLERCLSHESGGRFEDGTSLHHAVEEAVGIKPMTWKN